jgi:hypothetical protein
MKTLRWIVLFFLLPLPLLAQPDSLWCRSYNPGFSATSYAMDSAWGGGYVIAGKIRTTGELGRYFLLKTAANGDSIWCRTGSGPATSIPYAMHRTLDGGYFLAGRYDSTGGIYESYWLMKTDSLGNSLWSRTFHEQNPSETWSKCYAAIQTSDSGYLLTGMIGSGDYYSAGRVWVIKTNSSGDSLWSWKYTWPGGDLESRVIRELNDGSFLIGLRCASRGFGLVRLSAEGDSIWSGSYYTDDSQIYSITPARDGGFFFAGRYDGWHGIGWRWVRTDAHLDTLWTGQYIGYGTRDGEAHAALESADGGFIVAGTAFDQSGGTLLRLSPQGRIAWTQTFDRNASTEYWGLLPGPDNGFVLTGFYRYGYPRVLAVSRDYYRIADASPQSIQFDTATVGEAPQRPLTIINRGTEPFAIADPSLSDSNSFRVDRLGESIIPEGDSLVYLVTFRPQDAGPVSATLSFTMPHPPWPSTIPLTAVGRIRAEAGEPAPKLLTFALFPAYPNPFNPETRIKFNLARTAPATVQVFDISGRVVATLLDEVTLTGHHAVPFNGSALPSGVYFCRLQSGDFSATQKMLLLK